MAVGTSSPELFINLIGTFVTEGDIGVGMIVGSAAFNILAVPAAAGLFTGFVNNNYTVDYFICLLLLNLLFERLWHSIGGH